MGELSAEEIAERVINLNLLDDRQLQEAWSELGRRNVPGDQFVQLLVRREMLTNYQVERLLKGEKSGYFYGDYKVLYLVASGSFARVYRAVHKQTGDVVALKVLRRRYSDDPQHAEQFCREGEMGRTLRHPNIVPIYEVFSKSRSHFLVMEFVEGRNLRDFIKIRKKLDAEEATRLMCGIAAGLNYAFQRGVSHRDLKMSNVLVSSRGEPKLVDFGLAAADDRISDDALANHPNPRTIDYAGLERATGVRKDDARSDIYFLGCIYYHMLLGKPPLQETKDRIQRLSRSRFLDVVPISQADPDLPFAVTSVVEKAMDLNPHARYQNPGQMLLELNHAARQLTEGAAAGSDGKSQPSAPASAATAAIISQQRRPVMCVESDVRMQDIFRDALKRCGYRVLLTSDPARALTRFEDDAKAADCVIFSTVALGETALEAFNRFAEDEQTTAIPAVLLLGEPQRGWKSKAKLDKHRVAVEMPIKLSRLRSVLAKLLPSDSA